MKAEETMEQSCLAQMKTFQDRLNQLKDEKAEYEKLYQTLDAEISVAKKEKASAVADCQSVWFFSFYIYIPLQKRNKYEKAFNEWDETEGSLRRMQSDKSAKQDKIMKVFLLFTSIKLHFYSYLS